MSREPTWVCDKCGTEYTADIGKCGQLQPLCDGTVRPWRALDQYLATRSKIEAGEKDTYELSLSDCCRALLLIWTDSEDFSNFYSCTACHEQADSAEEARELRDESAAVIATHPSLAPAILSVTAHPAVPVADRRVPA